MCDKCVDVYDHHCKWLNNCVGVKTYKQFLRLLGTAWLMTLLQFAGGVVVFIEFLLLSEDEFSDKVAAVLGCTTEVAADAMCTTPSLDPLTYLILSVVVTGILGVTVGMITQLFVFHINLGESSGAVLIGCEGRAPLTLRSATPPDNLCCAP